MRHIQSTSLRETNDKNFSSTENISTPKIVTTCLLQASGRQWACCMEHHRGIDPGVQGFTDRKLSVLCIGHDLTWNMYDSLEQLPVSQVWNFEPQSHLLQHLIPLFVNITAQKNIYSKYFLDNKGFQLKTSSNEDISCQDYYKEIEHALTWNM